MNYWEYRAYDADRNVVNGVAQAKDFLSLALSLRQRGLQILTATKLNQDRSLAAKRLILMRNRLNTNDDYLLQQSTKYQTPPRGIRNLLINVLRGLQTRYLNRK